MKYFSVYTKKKLERVLKVIAEMNDDKDLPRDFDACITVLSNSIQGYPLNEILHPVDTVLSGKKFRNFDEEMQYKHPKDYGGGVDYAEEGHMAMPVKPFPVLQVYMQWANINGQ